MSSDFLYLRALRLFPPIFSFCGVSILLESYSNSILQISNTHELLNRQISISSSGTKSINFTRRGYHVELGACEKALLEEDPALKRFKSYKNTVKRVSKIGDALTILVVAASSYQIYAVAMRRKEERLH